MQPAVEERDRTDARFEKAVLELLHANDTYVQEDADPAALPWGDADERRREEARRDATKWRAVARAAQTWH